MILFDLDGTLIDSSLGIYEAYKSAVIKYNTSPISHKKLSSYIGPPFNQMLELIHPELNVNKNQLISEAFSEIYCRYDYYSKFKPREGLEEFIRKSSVYSKLGILTNKRTNAAIQIMKKINIHSHFEYIAGRDYFDKTCNSKSIVLNKIIKSEEYATPECYVGDTYSDLIMSEQYQIQFIAVRSLFESKTYLPNAVDTLECLLKKICKYK